MEFQIHVLIVIISILMCLSPVAQTAEGTATYYTPPYVPSSRYGYRKNGVMIATVSGALWNNRAACGRRYRVTCIGSMYQGVRPCTGKSVVKVVDYCRPGCRASIDLSKAAFSVIANPGVGKIKIQYTQI